MKEALYKKAWELLATQLGDLANGGVQSVHPMVVIGYMLFIEQQVEYQERLIEARGA